MTDPKTDAQQVTTQTTAHRKARVHILWKVLGVVFAIIVVALIILRITGLSPQDQRPGLWLTGEPVKTPVTDWSFTDKYPTLQIQARSWYVLPHSVTIFCATYNGHLYLASPVAPGEPKYPNSKREWNRDVARDPHVRLRIDNRLYDVTLTHVTDPAEYDGVLKNRQMKYPNYKLPAGTTFNVFRVESQ